MFTKITNLLIYSFCFLFSLNSFAAKVIQLKNEKVLIDLEGSAASPDQVIVLVNAQNKKVALAKINQVKNGKAIATITKGQSQGNESVTFVDSAKSAAAPKSTSETTNNEDSSSNSSSKINYKTSSKKVSAVFNLMSNTMNTKQADGTQPTPNTEDVAMTGSTFGVTGIVDWPIFQALSLRGTLGYEPFKTSGTSRYLSCDSLTSTNCTADITYLSAGAYARVDFTKSRTQFWGALGGDLKFPLAKSTTALKQDDIKMTMTYGVALGLDFYLNAKTFIPASLEQQYFMKSDTVSASILYIRVGYGQTF